jgi:DnaA-homolog protein
MGQLPLALRLSSYARFETYVAGVNATAVAHLRAVAAGESGALWIWGPPASGKTHLLQAACRSATDGGKRAMYVPLAEHKADPAIIESLESVDLLALDGLEHAAGDAAWERRLFVLFNEISAKRGGLLLTARSAAAAVGLSMPDLASRCAGAIAYRVQPLADEDRLAALLAHASARGLELERGAAEYLLHRVDRDMAGLGRWLDRLDRASLIEQRKLTIPFIRGLLAAEGASGE